MKSRKIWSLVERAEVKEAVDRGEVRADDELALAVLRRLPPVRSRSPRLSPGLRDRVHRLTTFLRAAVMLHPFRFGGSYDRA